MNRYKRAKVLLLDDLFKGSVTKSDVNIVFEIVNFRVYGETYNKFKNCIIVV